MSEKRQRCPLTGCIDDICQGTGECLITGWPLAQRCPICNEASLPEFDILCACERDETEGW